MVDVIAWPPVATIGFENTHIRPISRSTSLWTGKEYVSAAPRERRVATVKVGGIGSDMAGAGYVEMFKRYLDGGLKLARVNLCAPVWYGALRGLADLRGSQALAWREGDADLDWTEGLVDLNWTVGQPVAGVAGSFDGMHTVYCTGLPANRVVAFPSEMVRVVETDGTTHTARVVRVAKASPGGAARLFLDGPVADGAVLIGYRESVVYRVQNVNEIRAVQPVSGNFSYTFDLRQVFEDETDGFTEVDPWK
ncbi:hypothetical protein Q4525_14775 [Shimia thalassica]|uniref:hypothetical protein n=1 Tax=Shimia thalassica TaxID=1715693 RepID=UPI001C095C27|nr:hypothetical protein [Shimia thalassica]MBU2941072.1 hypothetical protein [Shimia thalassica]MDO6504201.1 hypothetical protein [Shimia thalassica]